MNNTSRILWLIEHTSRELDVACAVKVLLEKKYKKEITILPYASPETEMFIKTHKPQLVLLPFCYSMQHDEGLRSILPVSPDVLFFNVAWEQVFYKANLEYKAPRDEFARKFVFHHAWSRKRTQFLQEKGVPKEHIFVNGHPAYKLYDQPYRSVFVSQDQLATQFGLNPRKKWIFFPENYSWFFYSKHQLEQIIKNGQDRETAYVMRDYCKRSFTEVIRWMEELARKNKSVEIILRPRPAFSLEYFLQVLHTISQTLSKKIHILKDYSAREWILASDVVVSSFSTTLIEAAIAKKSLFMLEPFETPKALIAEWYTWVKKIKTKKEFLHIGKKDHETGTYSKLNSWARKEFFVNPDPIMGLVDYFGDLQVQPNSQQRQYVYQVIKQQYEKKWKLLHSRAKIILGTAKRRIFENKAYYRNDDSNRYMREINEKTAIYRSFFK